MTVALFAGANAPAIGRAEAQAAAGSTVTVTATPAVSGIHQIQHVVVIMQENRSFDEYFGMYPGADGIPVDGGGNPTVCAPDPQTQKCVAPYHDSSDINQGGPHLNADSQADVDGGKMDGFIASAEAQGATSAQADTVMGYKLRSDIPNYWSYADNFVLQDHMYEPVASWSNPSHLSLVSGWSAICTTGQVQGCTSNVEADQDGDLASPKGPGVFTIGDGDDDSPFLTASDYLWTDLSYLLYQHGVSWRYYRGSNTPEIWNPLVDFQDVHDDNQLGNVSLNNNLYADAAAGTLPSVSWVVPNPTVSDHPPASVSASQSYVTGVINALMQSPEWSSTAIFLAWDDWGGFYDHGVPPQVDANGYGMRVPGLLISPYARTGYIDHQTLSFDAYLKFIEDDFLGGQRLDPATDGRPDTRPDVRENASVLGDLSSEFDFTQPPRPPMPLLAAPAGHAQQIPLARAGSAASSNGTAPFSANLSITISGATAPTATWSLDFGDGTPPATGTGEPSAPIPHTYARPGTYTATASVTDQNSVTSTGGTTVTVGPATPLASLVAYRAVGVAPLTVTFDGSLSTDADDPLASWSLNYGDGSSPATGTGVPPNNLVHTYQTAGSYTAVLTVTDQDGNLSPGASQVIQLSKPAAPFLATYGAIATSSGEVLSGAINPNGDRATYHFDWGPTSSYGSSTPSMDTNFSNVLGPVSGLATNVTPNTTYHWRIVASNGTGRSVGGDHTFITSVRSPVVVTTGKPSGNSLSSVNVVATVIPGGLYTSAQFDYGTTTSYGSQTTAQAIGNNQSAVTVTSMLSNLAPKTIYHYRVEATNSAGTSDGTDVSFGLFPPSVSAGSAGGITATSATIGGSVNPNLVATTFHVDYGPTQSYGLSTAETSVGSGATILSVSAPLSGLHPATTYHYRLTATNGLGTVSGPDKTFRTPGLPVVTTGGVSGIDSADVNGLGQVNPEGSATAYWFQYGRTTSYTQATVAGSAGMGTVATPAQATMKNIVPKTLYHYRLVASNSSGKVYGADATFVMGPPTATTGSAFSVTSTSASAGGLVAPGVNATTYVVQYGPTTAYGSSSSRAAIGAGAAKVTVSAALTGLHAGSLYHFRLVATNSFGTSFGADRTFSTLAGATPAAVGSAPRQSSLLWIFPPPAFVAATRTKRRRRSRQSAARRLF